MPVGIPKVAFRNPGDEDASWVDLYNRLYRERMLFLTQMLSNEIGNQLIGLMIYLSIEDKTRELYLFINSPGGWLIPGVGLYDTMQFVAADVNTIGLGFVASIACFILLGGTITKRVALPNIRVMMHQPLSVFYDSQSGSFNLDVHELLHLRDRVTEAYMKRTGKPFWVINADLERDDFMSATQTKEYGIVDDVALEHSFSIKRGPSFEIDSDLSSDLSFEIDPDPFFDPDLGIYPS